MDAYEIRLELLKLAQSIESERVWSERQRLEQDWNTKVEQARERKWETNVSFPILPSATYHDIIKVAKDLNDFVSNKG